MIHEHDFVLSRGQFAIARDSLEVIPNGDYPSAWCTIQAVWYRKKGGLLYACAGSIRELCDPVPGSVQEFLEGFTDGRYGGHCEGRWDGERYWGSHEPDVMLAHILLLGPMMANVPSVPEGYEPWWRFPTRREMAALRAVAH